MSKILADHTQSGKKFIPPFVQQFGRNFTAISWDNDTIPEIIWISFLNADMGIQTGSEFLVDVCKNVVVNERAGLHSMAMISNYDLLGLKEKEKTINNLERNNLLKPLMRILEVFLNTYPLCPLNFLVLEPNKQVRNEHFIDVLKTTLKEFYRRDSETGVFSAASVIYNQFINGHMVVNQSTNLASFPEVQHYPNTEKSKMIASSIMSAIKMLHNPQLFNSNSNWKKYFWDTTYKLEPCKI